MTLDFTFQSIRHLVILSTLVHLDLCRLHKVIIYPRHHGYSIAPLISSMLSTQTEMITYLEQCRNAILEAIGSAKHPEGM